MTLTLTLTHSAPCRCCRVAQEMLEQFILPQVTHPEQFLALGGGAATGAWAGGGPGVYTSAPALADASLAPHSALFASMNAYGCIPGGQAQGARGAAATQAAHDGRPSFPAFFRSQSMPGGHMGAAQGYEVSA